MKTNHIITKRIVDIGMTILLLCLMAYQVTGEAAHEWIGMAMTVLVVVHDTESEVVRGAISRKIPCAPYRDDRGQSVAACIICFDGVLRNGNERLCGSVSLWDGASIVCKADAPFFVALGVCADGAASGYAFADDGCGEIVFRAR